MKQLNDLAELIKQGEVDESIETVKKIIDEIAVEQIVGTMTAAMRELGERFEKKEVFIPELLVASDVITALMPLLEPYIRKRNIQRKTVVIGTVEGDIHEIGKNIVSIVLKAEGYNVIDLGTDVGIDTFLGAASEQGAWVIGLSTLMTTTMHVQQDLVRELIAQGERDSYFVIIGGAPVSSKWADRIGADAYRADAFSTAALLNSLS
jgi:methanogenic corrinoid protein MtbC1